MKVRAVALRSWVAAGLVVLAIGCGGQAGSPRDAASNTSADVPGATADVTDVTVAPTDIGPATMATDGGPTADPDAGTTGGPTYWHDVAPLVNARCTQCHTTGGLAPFTLLTFADVQPRAAQIAMITAAGTMPPWPPAEDCIAIQNDRSLTPAQIAMLSAWLEAGAPEGDPSTYVPWPDAPMALPAMPSATVQPAMPYTPQMDVLDDYHCFVINPNLAATEDVIGVAFHPGNPRIVHHVILYSIAASSVPTVMAMDAASGGHGYTCFGGPGVDFGFSVDGSMGAQFVTAWAPGSPPVSFPPGTGIRVPSSDYYVMQVHYNQANGYGMTDQTSVDLYYSPAPVSQQAFLVPIVQQDFTLNPGDPNASASISLTPASYGVPLATRVWGSFPHMHLLGTDIRVDVAHADGTDDCLIHVPAWNFHWQGMYFYENPVVVQPNDIVNLNCHYNNSAANQPVINGVQQAPRTVHWGESTTDEMCLDFVYATIL